MVLGKGSLNSSYKDSNNPPQITLQDTFVKVKKLYVTAEQLKALGMKNVNDIMVADLNQVLEKLNINTSGRIRHFLAQCAKESDLGEGLTEYGNKQYWIESYWLDEERRGCLGNLSPEDAVKFRGAGYIQITGRDNYQKFADYVGDPQIMEGGAEYVAAKYPWLAAGIWWEKNNMNVVVDNLRGVNPSVDVNKVTDVVNLYTGEESRMQRIEYYKILLGIIPDNH